MHTESYVYLLANNYGNVLYTGVTSNLLRRIYEHKNKMVPGFTQKYNVDRLVYFEVCLDIMVAIAREKQIKGWLRAKKVALIESLNPEWKDLSRDWSEERDASPPSALPRGTQHDTTSECHSERSEESL